MLGSPNMNSFTRYMRRHHIALLALFLALGGTSYAAISLPKASVGTDQLKHASVTTGKIAPQAITGKRLDDGAVARHKIRDGAVDSEKVADGTLLARDFASGQLPAGATGAAGPAGPPGPVGPPGTVADATVGDVPAVRLIRGSTPFAIPTGGQGTAIAWPEPTGPRPYDIGGFFEPADNTIPQCVTQGTDTCIVFPRSGTYVVSAGVRWDVNATGIRTVRIHGTGGRQSGSTTTPAVSGTQTIQSVTTVDRFNAGDAAFVSAFQDTGADLNVIGSLQQVYFAATWLGP
jgi:hypothetical protein